MVAFLLCTRQSASDVTRPDFLDQRDRRRGPYSRCFTLRLIRVPAVIRDAPFWIGPMRPYSQNRKNSICNPGMNSLELFSKHLMISKYTLNEKAY